MDTGGGGGGGGTERAALTQRAAVCETALAGIARELSSVLCDGQGVAGEGICTSIADSLFLMAEPNTTLKAVWPL